jgi:mobilization protein MobC
VAIFNVRLEDGLAGRFDAWAADRGGRSAALRRLIADAARQGPPAPFRPVRAAALPLKLTVRLSQADGLGLAAAAAEAGLTRNAWAAAVVRRRVRGAPTFSRPEVLTLIAIQAELRRIGVNVNQIARALNTAVLEGPVLALELDSLEDFRTEIRGHLAGLREAFAGNLAYWDADR